MAKNVNIQKNYTFFHGIQSQTKDIKGKNFRTLVTVWTNNFPLLGGSFILISDTWSQLVHDSVSEIETTILGQNYQKQG